MTFSHCWVNLWASSWLSTDDSEINKPHRTQKTLSLSNKRQKKSFSRIKGSNRGVGKWKIIKRFIDNLIIKNFYSLSHKKRLFSQAWNDKRIAILISVLGDNRMIFRFFAILISRGLKNTKRCHWESSEPRKWNDRPREFSWTFFHPLSLDLSGADENFNLSWRREKLNLRQKENEICGREKISIFFNFIFMFVFFLFVVFLSLQMQYDEQILCIWKLLLI